MVAAWADATSATAHRIRRTIAVWNHKSTLFAGPTPQQKHKNTFQKIHFEY
jgi:hypothetical protein